MTREEWVHGEAMRIWRECGNYERTMENVALIEMACLSRRADGYMGAVGAPPPAGIEKEVATAYWEHVADNPPHPPGGRAKRERMLAAVDRFEEEMGFRPSHATFPRPPR